MVGVVLLRHIPPGSKSDSGERQGRDNVDGDDGAARDVVRHFGAAVMLF